MATTGQVITNRVTGERVQFTETAGDNGGQRTRFELRAAPGSAMPVRHLHLRQTETIELLSGRFKVECSGKEVHLDPGDTFTIPPGEPHQWWNTSDSEEAHLRFTIEPSEHFEEAMEQIFGICNDRGKLPFLQIMVMARRYEMIIDGPPLFLQKLMWALLAPVGRLLGYKAYYPEYSAE